MECRLFPEGTIPEWTTPEWYAGRERAPHLEQAGHRERLLKTFQMSKMAVNAGCTTVSDLGAGDGGLLFLIKRSYKIDCWGYDLQESNTDAANDLRKVNVRYQDVIRNWNKVVLGELVIATEMLEHLIDPHLLVKQIFDSPSSKWIIASSPANETLGSHYEYHTWAWDPAGYRSMLEEAGWVVERHDLSTMCQIILARKP